ncbi:nuclear transport factor 2 family protein [Cyanobium sp. N5-Cardenillas]|uniref:nuclear transport factor 2 family protein n=1 Tax=Cyanobium sp. N5-Cardenillas TaxID=2823720 RepID=UPI0020CC37B9|nr:nuclear transport factor 2 family protein [Cyanobium sp. N5-Cardenillas]MCP9787201.1 nuclear transport factor 2 family protein [Cyanobium sp. N5-Cardenillas]
MTQGPGTDQLSGGFPRRAGIAGGAATATAALALAGCSTAPKTATGAESASAAAAGSGAAGATNFNVTDRMALTQLIHAYAIEVDRFNIDGWFALFTDDAVFSVGLPGMAPVEQTGESFRSFWRTRFGDFERSGNRRKHLISNILFVEQTDSTSHAVISGLITNAKDGKTFSVVSGVDYEGWFVKKDVAWLINRWNDRPDVSFDGGQ